MSHIAVTTPSTERVYLRQAIECRCAGCPQVINLPTLTLTGDGHTSQPHRLSWGHEDFLSDELAFNRGKLLQMVESANGGISVEVFELRSTPDAAGIVGPHLPVFGTKPDQAFWLCEDCSQRYLAGHPNLDLGFWFTLMLTAND